MPVKYVRTGLSIVASFILLSIQMFPKNLECQEWREENRGKLPIFNLANANWASTGSKVFPSTIPLTLRSLHDSPYYMLLILSSWFSQWRTMDLKQKGGVTTGKTHCRKVQLDFNLLGDEKVTLHSFLLTSTITKKDETISL